MSIFARRRGNRKPAVPSSSSPAANASRNAVVAVKGGPNADVEARIHAIGSDYLKSARRHQAGLLSGAFWQDKLMNWAMKDPEFKVQLFRFVDAFPRLKTPDAVHAHLVDYLSQPGVTPPPFMGAALKAGGIFKGTFTKQMTSRIEGMARNFIAGRDAKSAEPLLETLWKKKGIAFSVDLLGEVCVNATEAAMYQRKYLDLVESLPPLTNAWPAIERLERDHLGVVPRTNVSVKISALYEQCDPIAHDSVIDALRDRLRPILESARDRGVFINFDMEHHALKDLTLDLFMRCCEDVDFHAGLAMQAYLRSGDDDARRIIDWSKATGRQVTVRLVKGAYWDYETIHAEQEHWPVPVWGRKHETDACFERMTQLFVDGTPRAAGQGGVKLALGSHNARSIGAALAMLEAADLPRSAIELQMLHGMGEELKAAATEMDLRVREYVPVGDMIPGMAYLVRRLLENTSNESWLRAGFEDDADLDSLLASPHRAEEDMSKANDALASAPEKHQLSRAADGVADGRPMTTEPMRNFAYADVRQTFARSVASARVPEVAIDATIDDANRALDAAHAAFPRWRERDVRDRSAMLVRAAEIMRRRRDELCGILMREAGKNWRNTDGEVCEAIDFCEYYAREAVHLFEPERLGRYVGEHNSLVFQPRGICTVISPWNFPFAILCGMTVAALVTGNTAIIKPAEQTPGIGRVLFDILLEAGVPDDVLHFIPGQGETVGAHLVRDPRVAVIAFTGSRAVGLNIIEAAGLTPQEQPFVKRVVCEMGGKNAIIVDSSADLDEAVLGVRDSAFGYQGQKCSACSRVIVLDDTHDEFVERLVDSTRSLVIGDPTEPATDVAWVIDEAAKNNIDAMIASGREQATLALAMDLPPSNRLVTGRHYVAPHIFTDVPRDARIAREEIFGPVLAVLRAKDFDDAIDLAVSSEYRLTGSVYTRKPSHIDQARRDFRVGNLYINRGSTGALVARQPFGGFGMSGVGSKAGGPDYLHQFVEPRAITENTMRRGFAPELETGSE